MTTTPKKLTIAYIGGGSRQWAWTLMQDLCFEKDLGGIIRLYDLDHEAALTNQAIGQRLLDTHNPGAWCFQALDSLYLTLAGADFVFVSILPGTFDHMAVDVHAPEAHGIWQSVGDTAGIGGLMRALRTIPAYQVIARAIQEHCPDAWVFNYTNPMALCTRTLYRVFPGIKALGCCHEVFHVQDLLVRAASWAGLAGPGSITREQVHTRVMGINHFTWIDQASWKQHDLIPVWDAWARAHAATGVDEASGLADQNPVFKSREKVKFDLWLRYGLIAAAGDRHLAEFCPPSWYLADPETVTRWGFRLTPVSFRKTRQEALLARSKALAAGTETMVPRPSGEEGIRQVKALLGMGDLVTNVNVPNQGQIPNLPPQAVVETNAVLGRDRLEPIFTPGLPPAINQLCLHHIAAQEGLLQAALDRDLDQAFQVFLNEYQVQGLSPAKARDLFATMTQRTLDPALGYPS